MAASVGARVGNVNSRLVFALPDVSRPPEQQGHVGVVAVRAAVGRATWAAAHDPVRFEHQLQRGGACRVVGLAHGLQVRRGNVIAQQLFAREDGGHAGQLQKFLAGGGLHVGELKAACGGELVVQ